MMTKEYVVSILRREDMVDTISKLRTQFSTIMTDFYFFRTFIDSLKTAGVNIEIHNTIQPFSDTNEISKIVDNRYIVFSKDFEYLKINFDNDKLRYRLKEYNELQKNMSMLESAHALIDIFINILEEQL